jgi:phosphorylcholine metabolism protein LicD
MNKELNWIIIIVTTTTTTTNTNTNTGITLNVAITTNTTNTDIIKEEERKETLAYVMFVWAETEITHFSVKLLDIWQRNRVYGRDRFKYNMKTLFIVHISIKIFLITFS